MNIVKKFSVILEFLFFQCSFIPKFNIAINTRYEDNNGSTENVNNYYYIHYAPNARFIIM